MPRSTGDIARPQPIQARDTEFLRAATDRNVKITVPGPFTMSQQAQNDHYPGARALALAYADAVRADGETGGQIIDIPARPHASRRVAIAASDQEVSGTRALSSTVVPASKRGPEAGFRVA